MCKMNFCKDASAYIVIGVNINQFAVLESGETNFPTKNELYSIQLFFYSKVVKIVNMSTP